MALRKVCWRLVLQLDGIVRAGRGELGHSNRHLRANGVVSGKMLVRNWVMCRGRSALHQTPVAERLHPGNGTQQFYTAGVLLKGLILQIGNQ
ncbi:hypothetical protein MKX08_008763 [Trichoderma sp. CBMAI-0020]|nr:hypothetical protein MKX08_008763 [Trichoderma sp. CBMAI-0020]